MTTPSELIEALMRKDISDDAFLSRFPHPIREEGVLARFLSDAATREDGEAVDELLYLGSHFSLIDHRLVAQLSELLVAPWHQRHEDIAQNLQRLRAPESVAALCQASTMKHAYLEYDDSLGLARKCIWALGDINTDDARECLQSLAQSTDADRAKLAQRRLQRLEGKEP